MITMADVYIVTLSLIGILLSLPALLVALNLLMPRASAAAATRLERTPGKCFLLGVPVAAGFLLYVAIAGQIPFGLLRATAWIAGFAGMGLGTLGAAALARLLGERLATLSGPSSQMACLVRGALVYELACLTPIVGWLLFAPVAGVTVLGAAVFGLLHWLPRPALAPAPVAVARPS
jgi:hypothetical protein